MVKSLGHMIGKIANVTNQHLMTCFCIKPSAHHFGSFYCCFPINRVKKCSD